MNEIKLTLDSNTIFIILRFVLSNGEAVPTEMRGSERSPRKNQPARRPGRLIIDEQNMRLSVRDALNSLVKEGYVLVDGFMEERPGRLDLAGPGMQFVVGFTMLHREFVKKEPTGLQSALLAVSFDQIAEESLWRGCRGYENPCYDNDRLVEGATAVVLNFAARQPLCDRDGKPITERPRNAQGKLIRSEKARPICATHLLRVKNKVIRLVPAE